jgi:hypothetical protein
MSWSISLLVLALMKEASFLSLTFEPFQSTSSVFTCAPRNALSVACQPFERLSLAPAQDEDTLGQLRQCICHSLDDANDATQQVADAQKGKSYEFEGFDPIQSGPCMCLGQACAISCGLRYLPVCIRWTREPSAQHCAFQCRSDRSCEAFDFVERANETWCTLERGSDRNVPRYVCLYPMSLRVQSLSFSFDPHV